MTSMVLAIGVIRWKEGERQHFQCFGSELLAKAIAEEGCENRDYSKVCPVSLSSASKYLSLVLLMTSDGSLGGGGSLGQSRPSK